MFYASVRTYTLQPALGVNSYQVSWFIETNKQKKKKNVARYIFKGNVPLVESAKVAKYAEAQAQNLSGVTGTLLGSKLRKVYFTFLSSGSEV